MPLQPRLVVYKTTQQERNAMLSGVAGKASTELSAIVTGENTDGTVNLRIFYDGEGSFRKESVSQGAVEGQYQLV